MSHLSSDIFKKVNEKLAKEPTHLNHTLVFFDPWYVPGDLPVRVEHRISTRHAKNIAKKSGHEYTSDQEALDDFVTTHWATLLRTQA